MLLREGSNWFYTWDVFSSTNRTDHCQSSSKVGSIKDALEQDLRLFTEKLGFRIRKTTFFKADSQILWSFWNYLQNVNTCIAFPRNVSLKNVTLRSKKNKNCVQRTVV